MLLDWTMRPTARARHATLFQARIERGVVRYPAWTAEVG